MRLGPDHFDLKLVDLFHQLEDVADIAVKATNDRYTQTGGFIKNSIRIFGGDILAVDQNGEAFKLFRHRLEFNDRAD